MGLFSSKKSKVEFTESAQSKRAGADFTIDVTAVP